MVTCKGEIAGKTGGKNYEKENKNFLAKEIQFLMAFFFLQKGQLCQIFKQMAVPKKSVHFVAFHIFQESQKTKYGSQLSVSEFL